MSAPDATTGRSAGGPVTWDPGADRLRWADQAGRGPWDSLQALASDGGTPGARLLERLQQSCGAARAAGGLIDLAWPALGGRRFSTAVLLDGASAGADVLPGWVVPLRPSTADALARRAVLDQAKGVLMARYGLDADEAFDELSRLSQNQNRKAVEVAADIVTDARGPQADPDQPFLVHRVIDMMLTPALLLAAVRDPDGRMIDLLVEHANPAAVDLDGRRTATMTGRRLLGLYPGLLESGVWDVYATALSTQQPYLGPRTPYVETTTAGRVQGLVELAAHPLSRDRLLVTWHNDPNPGSVDR
ncbi:ANTAR domain-containing protein [Phycicoccus avicenniae]|uniref:ANTAR domain-containing protein n=1 Tax=Phycicoccus avicenniae TaxID=2828860 RepID=UPI003D270F01